MESIPGHGHTISVTFWYKVGKNISKTEADTYSFSGKGVRVERGGGSSSEKKTQTRFFDLIFLHCLLS